MMDEPDLIWLAEQAQSHFEIVEVGSYLGRSTRALADNTEGTVYAIDDWEGPRDFIISIPQDLKPIIHDWFLVNMRGTKGKVVDVSLDHRKFANGYVWPHTRPDMVFIDGSHEYEDVKRDIDYWWGQLKLGGLMCGHDNDWPGVVQAIKEKFGSEFRLPEKTKIWAIEK
jgi:hypothetical protein